MEAKSAKNLSRKTGRTTTYTTAKIAQNMKVKEIQIETPHTNYREIPTTKSVNVATIMQSCVRSTCAAQNIWYSSTSLTNKIGKTAIKKFSHRMYRDFPQQLTSGSSSCLQHFSHHYLHQGGNVFIGICLFVC